MTTNKLIGKGTNDGFTKWVANALDKGAGTAHKWTSQKVKAPPRPETIKTDGKWLDLPEQNVDHYKDMWQDVWGQRTTNLDEIYALLGMISSKAKFNPMGPITGPMVQDGSKLTPTTAKFGIDQQETEWR